MTRSDRVLQVVAQEDLPEYPISASDRLDSHFFLQWNLKRWRASDTRRKAYADPEVGFYARELFDMSQDETPVGTLPCGDEAVAFLLRLPVAKWRELAARDVTPLHGWYRVICDNGEIRLAHDVVTEVAKEALKSKRKNAANAEQRRRAKRIADLRDMIERIGATQLLKNPAFLDRFNDWLEDNFDGVQRREGMIRAALDQFMTDGEP
ncbi:MAG TPA: hypothetical protein DIT40_08955 [Alphaproteobacteria bacterium]|nr:hypothetical protein [Alphaproteobacteria bacterium]